MEYQITLEKINKEVFPLGPDFEGENKKGEKISVNNFYLEKNGQAFFGISGEFHYSRMQEHRWEDELIKMKLAGINIVSTYVFWNHHEEDEGVFDFQGRRDIRRFVMLCQKHDLMVILRVGPFAHGEARNGGLPDWLYGKAFEVRTSSDGFMKYTRRWYSQIGEQVKGLFYKDGGPVIGVQIDNEYMHSSAPWEMTTGISNEWVFGGDEGDKYMLALKKLAAECGLNPVFYTCTGWGGAATPDSMLPLWGGYAYRPWLFYEYAGEHPATEEYRYQNFHKNGVVCTNDFKPSYQPEDRPYACCEMGGGMMCSYNYRFVLPKKSIDAMANIKLGSGCNFLGYYMFQGGSNPVGKNGTFLNESQVSKISYDYQAALGEFGQERESYRRLKTLHYFVNSFGERLCKLATTLPAGASEIDPNDLETLRFAVRSDGRSGFLFINNFQDHREMGDKCGEKVDIITEKGEEDIHFNIDIAGDENAILPFNFDMDGINLIKATAQPVTRIENDGLVTYVFMVPDGMKGEFQFESGRLVKIKSVDVPVFFDVSNDTTSSKCIRVMVVNRKMAGDMFVVGNQLYFTEGALLVKDGRVSVETTKTREEIFIYPKNQVSGNVSVKTEANALVRNHNTEINFMDHLVLETEKKEIPVEIKQVAKSRWTIDIKPDSLDGIKDALIQIDYRGDIGYAFVDGRMVHDNFYNGETWEIGLSDILEGIRNEKLTIYINPLKKGVKVNVESAMAARITPVYELAV